MARPGEETWKEHATPFERVRDVTLSVSEPRSATHIAEEAAVPMESAKEHLNSLVKLSVVLEHDSRSQTKYGPDPLYSRFQTIRSLLDSHDREELIELRDELQSQIDAWRDEYCVDSPDALKKRTAQTEVPPDTKKSHRIAREWELVEYRLNIIVDVINDYANYSCGDRFPA